MTRLAALLFLLPLLAFGEDLRLRDGTVYRRVKVSEVAADGLIVNHEKGMAKVDFEQLPKALQDRYGYDPAKAARFRAEQARIAQQTAAENQRLIKEHEERVMAKFRQAMQQEGDSFTYRGSQADAALSRQLNATMDAAVEEKLAAARAPETFWTAPLWQSPVMQVIGRILGGGGSGGGQSHGTHASDEFGYLSYDPARH